VAAAAVIPPIAASARTVPVGTTASEPCGISASDWSWKSPGEATAGPPASRKIAAAEKAVRVFRAGLDMGGIDPDLVSRAVRRQGDDGTLDRLGSPSSRRAAAAVLQKSERSASFLSGRRESDHGPVEPAPLTEST
jgi:hypothetical protein